MEICGGATLRVALGAAAGLALLHYLGSGGTFLLVLAASLPLRFAAWVAVLLLCLEPARATPRSLGLTAGWGTLVSYVADAPALVFSVFSAMALNGFHIC